jgi:hypothetical protein
MREKNWCSPSEKHLVGNADFRVTGRPPDVNDSIGLHAVLGRSYWPFTDLMRQVIDFDRCEWVLPEIASD